MAHSPAVNEAWAVEARPLYTNSPALAAAARLSMCLTCRGELIFRRALWPLALRPFCSVANSTLCQVEKDSSWVQPCHARVMGQLWPLALSFLAASNTSGQVVGALSGFRPAFLKASLL